VGRFDRRRAILTKNKCSGLIWVRNFVKLFVTRAKDGINMEVDKHHSVRNVLTLINELHFPNARTISEIIHIRKSLIHLDASSLMIKAYMLGYHDGKMASK
jgi:hypothetical protein